MKQPDIIVQGVYHEQPDIIVQGVYHETAGYYRTSRLPRNSRILTYRMSTTKQSDIIVQGVYHETAGYYRTQYLS
jgi:hypothetical protein